MKDVSNADMVEVMSQIKGILKENNLMGTVILANGLGEAEYMLGLDVPEFSIVKLEVGQGFRIKNDKSNPKDKENVERSVNAIFSICDVTSKFFLALDTIKKTLLKNLDIEVDKSPINQPHNKY